MPAAAASRAEPTRGRSSAPCQHTEHKAHNLLPKLQSSSTTATAASVCVCVRLCHRANRRKEWISSG